MPVCAMRFIVAVLLIWGSHFYCVVTVMGLTGSPTLSPTFLPTSQPSNRPSDEPTSRPSNQPSEQPISAPSSQPSRQPSTQPNRQPSTQPSKCPTTEPTGQPSMIPSMQPSRQPTRIPTNQPSGAPSSQPTRRPSSEPSGQPSRMPTGQPTWQPSVQPSSGPTLQPSVQPTSEPSEQPTSQPSRSPSEQPTTQPSRQPSKQPSGTPSIQPSRQPSRNPTGQPSLHPTMQPTRLPSQQPSQQPIRSPTSRPSSQPTKQPSCEPSGSPTTVPSARPSPIPTCHPTRPTTMPTVRPTPQPTSLDVPSIRFDIYVNLLGCTLSNLDSASKEAFIHTVAKFGEVPDYSVKILVTTSLTTVSRINAMTKNAYLWLRRQLLESYLEVDPASSTPATADRRHHHHHHHHHHHEQQLLPQHWQWYILDKNVPRRRLKEMAVTAATWDLSIRTRITVSLADFPLYRAANNETGLYQHIAGLLHLSVADGTFRSELRNVSLLNSGRTFITVTVDSIDVGEVTIYIPSENDDITDELSDSAIAGIVIGCLIGVIFIGFCACQRQAAHKKMKEEANEKRLRAKEASRAMKESEKKKRKTNNDRDIESCKKTTDAPDWQDTGTAGIVGENMDKPVPFDNIPIDDETIGGGGATNGEAFFVLENNKVSRKPQPKAAILRVNVSSNESVVVPTFAPENVVSLYDEGDDFNNNNNNNSINNDDNNKQEDEEEDEGGDSDDSDELVLKSVDGDRGCSSSSSGGGAELYRHIATKSRASHEQQQQQQRQHKQGNGKDSLILSDPYKQQQQQQQQYGDHRSVSSSSCSPSKKINLVDSSRPPVAASATSMYEFMHGKKGAAVGRDGSSRTTSELESGPMSIPLSTAVGGGLEIQHAIIPTTSTRSSSATIGTTASAAAGTAGTTSGLLNVNAPDPELDPSFPLTGLTALPIRSSEFVGRSSEFERDYSEYVADEKRWIETQAPHTMESLKALLLATQVAKSKADSGPILAPISVMQQLTARIEIIEIEIAHEEEAEREFWGQALRPGRQQQQQQQSNRSGVDGTGGGFLTSGLHESHMRQYNNNKM